MIREGKARWDEPIVVKKEKPVFGSSILQFLGTPLTLTLRDALTLMIYLSDNTAANLIMHSDDANRLGNLTYMPRLGPQAILGATTRNHMRAT